jgi:hypothetical protein
VGDEDLAVLLADLAVVADIVIRYGIHAASERKGGQLLARLATS